MRKAVIIKHAVLFLFFLLLSTQALPTPWAIEEMVGKPAPYFSLKGVDGREYSLTDFAGEVILLNFWASWCPPCRKELPVLEKIEGDYNGKGFRVVTISTDSDRSTLDAFLKKYPVKLIILHDSEMRIWRKYKVFSLPTSFLINRRGIIVDRFFGGHDRAVDELRRRIEEALE
ncbi:MAG: TlpA family protein disulfide reductase [Nitrospirae bacterium]|nr:MAG: TlpA family protein disulfide reductase [Nitrospirota bacterium]